MNDTSSRTSDAPVRSTLVGLKKALVDAVEPREIAAIKCQNQIALGDAFALATANAAEARLIVGADDDWDEPIADGYAFCDARGHIQL